MQREAEGDAFTQSKGERAREYLTTTSMSATTSSVVGEMMKPDSPSRDTVRGSRHKLKQIIKFAIHMRYYSMKSAVEEIQ